MNTMNLKQWLGATSVVLGVAAMQGFSQTTAAAQAGRRAPALGSTWSGTYGYTGQDDRPETTIFKMTIASVSELEGGGGYAIAGTISEPRNDFGPSNETTLLSTFTGKWTAGSAGAAISFTKTYRYDGHVVEYSGTYDESAAIIAGKWTITDAGGTATGPFTLGVVKLN
jgi:hypothetical protein